MRKPLPDTRLHNTFLWQHPIALGTYLLQSGADNIINADTKQLVQMYSKT